jgi:uncharacterized membrane protein YdbT with pleckstrin-like domain
MSKKAQNKKEFSGQHEDEEVDLVFHQHPIVMRKALLLGLIIWTVSALPLAFVIAVWPWYIFGVGFILMFLIIGYRWITWYYSIFIITNERLIQIRQKGFFNRGVTDISHNKIQSVNYEVKGLLATSFHFGTIVVQTYVGDLVLKYIHHPEDVQQLLVKDIRAVRPADISGPKDGE